MILSDDEKNKLFIEKWREIDDAVSNLYQHYTFTCDASEIDKAWGYWIREAAIEFHVREDPHNMHDIINEIISNPPKLIAQYWIDRFENYDCNRNHFEDQYYEDTNFLKFMCS